MRFIGSGSLWSKHDVAKRIERGMALFADDRPYFWTIERLDTGEVIGQGGLVEINFDGPEIELGYRLGKAYWGLGFASEIAQAAAHAAFTPRSEGGFGFDRLVAVCIPENEPSRRVLAKAGFTEVGTTDVYYGVTSLLHEHRALNQ
ncbi:MAG: GNAT family N-acetyltransferase [Planctomycetota bacterium]